MKNVFTLFLMMLSMFILISCKDEPQDNNNIGEIRRVYKYNYEDYKESCENANDKYFGERNYLNVALPDYNFDGVVKKTYELKTICTCNDEEKVNDNTSNCANYYIRKVRIYCYTDEKNAFILEFQDKLDFNTIITDGLKKRNIDGEISYFASFSCSFGAGCFNFIAYQSPDEKTYEINDTAYGSYISNYTEKDIKYWYDLTFNTMKEYHKEIEEKK